MNKFIVRFLAVSVLLQAAYAPAVHAACAKVSMQILQQLTIERAAFDAKLGITNGISDTALQDVRVDVAITDGSGAAKNELFFVRPPTLTGISGTLDGSGNVAASTSGEAHWLIIPSPGAGGQGATGTDYWVGATLSYTINGNKEVISISPAKITVKPMPQLVLDYFAPAAVLGDNPFTTQVEAPIPYYLGLRVLNNGYGTATNLRLDSAQPKIVDNKQGLLIDFKLLGAAVNDGPVTPSLMVGFGDLASKKAATATWQMISTLSGKFTDFKTSFTHASELGGDLTSLITATNPHYLTHLVRVDLPGRDSRLDFLADLNNTSGTIYESEIPGGSTAIADAQTPVTVVPSVASAHPTPTAPSVSLQVTTGAAGWIYTKVADPSQGLLKLMDVVRADGVHLDPHNFWVDQGLDANYKKNWTLQFIDYRPDAGIPGAYTLVFTKPDTDTTPPTTALVFDGPYSGTNPTYITPETRVLLTATDNDGGSGVDGMLKKIAGIDAEFVPALPFNLTTPGNYSLTFYSTDLAGNVEAAKTINLVVVGAAPSINSFSVSPSVFSPQAPRGVAVARVVTIGITAMSPAAALPVEVAIAPGSVFQAAQVVRTLKGSAVPGTELRLTWDGKDSNGKLLPIGAYSVQAKVVDGLDNPADANAPSHTATAQTTVNIAEWFVATAVDPNPSAEQQHPRASGDKVVWQDQRNGRWDIYLKDLTDGASRLIPSTSPDRERPAIDGNVVVWQDFRNGTWDIYGFDLSTNTEFPISTASGDQTLPVIVGNWVAWQDNRNGNWDIYAYDLSSHTEKRITNHERDQLHPSISGTVLAWEDYRFGPGEIFQYDLATNTESQASFGPSDATFPALSGNSLVWSDKRTGQSDIFRKEPTRGALRVSYGTGDHTQPALLNDLLVYTDFEAGADDPNLSFRMLSSGLGGRLTSDTSRQEEPALGTNLVVWQDNRDGKFQIYGAPLATEGVPIEAQIKPGFNLVAVGSALATKYPNASTLLGATGLDFTMERLLLHEALHNSYTEAPAGGDFALRAGNTLVLYAASAGTLKLADSGETASYTLLPGTNQIGMLTAPFGLTAYDLMNSLGLDNVQSVRRFDAVNGAWQTVSVRMVGTGNALAGSNFSIESGDGLVITMKNRLDNWQP